MTRIDELFDQALRSLPPKPPDTADRAAKKKYSEKMSKVVANAFSEELRHRGLKEARPTDPGELGGSGAERRMAGGIGAKKVDVTWATEEGGLMFAASIKTINFRDRRTQTFQKNVSNRRGDMLFEAVTLHRRFPYTVLAGFFFFDRDAETDNKQKKTGKTTRRSTFVQAHARLKLFSGRDDPAGRDEQLERLYVVLVRASPSKTSISAYEAGKPEEAISLDEIFNELIALIAERNSDFYEVHDGRLVKLRGAR